MNYYDLRGMCDRYGIQIDLDITGQQWINDPQPGPGYRLYVWETMATGWPIIRVMGRIGFKELQDMSYADLEQVVVGCSVEAMGNAD